MRFSEVTFGDLTPVDGYGPGFFRIGGAVFEGALLLLPEGVRPWGGPDDPAPLVAAAGAVDLLFIGTGDALSHLPSALRAVLDGAGVMAEPMPTPAACRSYNVLLGEGRRVGAALVPVSAPGAEGNRPDSGA